MALAVEKKRVDHQDTGSEQEANNRKLFKRQHPIQSTTIDLNAAINNVIAGNTKNDDPVYFDGKLYFLIIKMYANLYTYVF